LFAQLALIAYFMKLYRLHTLLFSLIFTIISLPAANEPIKQTWTVGEHTREALIYVPPTNESVTQHPLIFAFHGHGGSMHQANKSFGYEQQWPEALIVYPQGLPTPGKLTDPEGKKPGWQSDIGDQGDRDLLFFDAMLNTLLTQFHADKNRIYCTGHSNGGGFTYLLGAARGQHFAALAPSAAAASRSLRLLKPLPIFHVAGENDPLVKFDWQQRTIAALRIINKCEDGVPWENQTWCTYYASSVGAPVVTCIHPGTHTFLQEAPKLITQFFKSHVRVPQPAIIEPK
jgi:polyhydroxybutyrate depolymerase